jgi:hypothetical protein
LEILLRIGGVLRQSSNSSSTIGLDRRAARLLNIYGINDTSTSRYHCALGGKRQGIRIETSGISRRGRN